MLQDGHDGGLEEGQVHEADAAQITLLLVLGDHLAQPADHLLGRGAQCHHALVLGRDRQVVECQAGQVAPVARFLRQALGQRREHVPLPGAHHGHAVLLVAHIAELVDALDGRGRLFAFLLLDGLEELGDVVEMRRLCFLPF